ncbi:hypothetical protein C475_18933 [Halosimplex carlsbadense 2-9-1]|uniref:DUF8168 domain-containing protein n=1 Tax=Halosimplex carlsbadense 2-9-1 TaxID=797114 RepID=M0CEK9_9EURY|nr:hypothetical protein [Halosimplex carlsbadense]ELZ21063.1 hypothetical protein C475_18933 [Halosimplex carlsbadense 2-9-1]
MQPGDSGDRGGGERWVVDAAEFCESRAGGEGASGMLVPYRHGTHKLRGRTHENADSEYAGVRVNEQVPLHADRDAALLSRPAGEPELTVANHRSPYRLSLVSGDVAVGDVSAAEIESAVEELVTVADPVAPHQAWLESWVASLFSESLYFPYTSLKYHTLLVAALLSNYRAGVRFEELHLVVESTSRDPTPHRTVLQTDQVSLRVSVDPGDRPAARLGAGPARSFADVWSRLSEHPGDADGCRAWRVLDAQLRRIRSWSTALQFIEDFVARRGEDL